MLLKGPRLTWQTLQEAFQTRKGQAQGELAAAGLDAALQAGQKIESAE